MASQEEDKLECISNVNKEQEIYYLNIYKKYEWILNNKSEPFENKVQSLIDVWKSIAKLDLKQFDIRYVIQIIDWAKLHALNIVLTGEWRSMKEIYCNALLDNIEKAQNNLRTINDAFSTRCQKLAHVVKKPWEHPVLTHLLHTRDAEIGSEEIEFFCVETAYLVSVRLKKLCENHCEDLALNLVTNFIACKKLSDRQNFSLNATETQIWFIFDIYIALLFKFQDREKILQNFEELKLEEGYQLVKRFAKKRVKISKIWRNCHKVALFGSRFFLLRTLMKYSESSEELMKELLENLMKIYIFLSNTEALLQQFVSTVRTITSVADAAGLCFLCEIIHTEVGTKIRHFAIEMYIRALTTDMNELEKLKHLNEHDKVHFTTSRLARTFTNLADLLKEHVNVSRECVLTAFSLEPTKDRLNLIQELAQRSGFPVLDTGQEWKCHLHPPVLPSDDIAWMCSVCGDWMCKPQLNAPAMKTNTPLNEALQESVLGVSEALCDDLAVCLSNPRYQVLSWLLPWTDLYRLCVMYLNDPEKTKNFVTELKYVDIDYSLFQHIKKEPIDEYTGIEKGYEQYLDLNFVSDEEEISSVSEDSSQDRALSLGSDGSGEPYSLPQPKSDPKTLKSLRMFRPSMKRKMAGSENDLPDKHFKADSEQALSLATASDTFSNSPCSLSEILGAQYSTGKTVATGADSPVSNVILSEPSACNNSESLDSKNGVVATLPPLGGQVAVNSLIQPIQVHHPEIWESTRQGLIQLLQNRSLYSGTKENSEKPDSDYSMNSNRDDLLSTKEIFAKMLALHNPQNNQGSNSLPLPPSTEMNPSSMEQLLHTLAEHPFPHNRVDIQHLQSTLAMQPSRTTFKGILSEAPLVASQTHHQTNLEAPQNLTTLDEQHHSWDLSRRSIHRELTETITTAQQPAISTKWQSCHQTSTRGPVQVRTWNENMNSDLEACQSPMAVITSQESSQASSSRVSKPKITIHSTKVLKVTLTKLSEEEVQRWISRDMQKSRGNPPTSNSHRKCSKKSIVKKEARQKTTACSSRPDKTKLNKIFKTEQTHFIPASETHSLVNSMEVELSNVQKQMQTHVQNSIDLATQQKIEVANAMLCLKELKVCLTKHVVEHKQVNVTRQNSIEQQQTQDVPEEQRIIEPTQEEQHVLTNHSKEVAHPPESVMNLMKSCQLSQEDHPNLADCFNQQTKQANTMASCNNQKQQRVKSLAQLAQQVCSIMMEQGGAADYSYQKMQPFKATLDNMEPSQEAVQIITEESKTSVLQAVSQDIKILYDKELPITQNQVSSQMSEHPEIILSNKEQSDSPSNNNILAVTAECIPQINRIKQEEQTGLITDYTNQQINPIKITLCEEKLLDSLSYCKETTTQATLQETILPVYSKPPAQELVSLSSQEPQTQVTQISAPAIQEVSSETSCVKEEEDRSFQATVDYNPQEVESSSPVVCKEEPVLVNSLQKQTKLPVPPTQELIQESLEDHKIIIPKEEPMTLPSNQQEHSETFFEVRVQTNLDEYKIKVESSQEMDMEKIVLYKEKTLLPSQNHKEQTNTKVISLQEIAQLILQKDKIKVELTEESDSQQTELFKTTFSVELPPVPANSQRKQMNRTVPTLKELSQAILEKKTIKIEPTECSNEELDKTILIKEEPLDSQQEQLNTAVPPLQECQTEMELDKTNSCKEKLIQEDQIEAPISPIQEMTELVVEPTPYFCPQMELDLEIKEEPSSPSSSLVEQTKTLVPSLQEIAQKSLDQWKQANLDKCSSLSKQFPKTTSSEMEVLATVNSPKSQSIMSQTQGILSTVKEIPNVCLSQSGTKTIPQNSQLEKQLQIFSLENIPNTTIQAEPDTEVNVLAKGLKVKNECSDINSIDVKEPAKIKDVKLDSRNVSLPKENTKDQSAIFNKTVKPKSLHIVGSFEQFLKSFNYNEINETTQMKNTKEVTLKKSSIGYIDDEIFCDLTDYKSEEEFFNICNKNTTPFKFYQYMDDLEKHYTFEEEMPNKLSESLKKYKNTHKIQHWNVPCFKIDYDNELQHSKTENATNSRLPPKNAREDDYVREKRCRRTTKYVLCHCCASPKKRKVNSKPEKYYNKRRKIQNKKTSPLLDKNKKDGGPEESNAAERAPGEVTSGKPTYVKKVLKQVPGLYDYDMLAPTNRNQIINVVQVSNSRTTSQNTQTSTQISPHIQRIGQPRVVEQKPESSTETSVEASTSADAPTTSTATIAKPSSSQPSTLINILSQQIIRPGQNAVRRQGPLINILSQQIIRPSQQNHAVQRAPAASIASTTTETGTQQPNNAVKPESTTSDTISQSQVDTTAKNVPSTTSKSSTNQGGTILQFICKSSLPKFQQAFGKAVFTNSNSESTETTTSTTVETATNTPNVEIKKIIPSKTVPVNVQPIQGNVIYRGQMPVGQTISLIPPGSTTRQLFRITGSTHEQISLVKESVIQNKMSALLAAALQSKPKTSDQNGEMEEVSATRITLCRPGTQNSGRIVKPVQLQIPTNVIRSPQPNMSSTTLEQLREFDMVYKQIKERSSNTSQSDQASNSSQDTNEQSSPQQRISFTYVNQTAAASSPVLSVSSQSNTSSSCVTPASTTLPKIASKPSKGKSLKSATPSNTAKAAPALPKPQQKPQEDEQTAQRIFDILAEYAEQLRNSPDLNNKPAPRRRSNPPNHHGGNSKRKKGSASSKKVTIHSSNTIEIETDDLTMGSEDSSGGNIVHLSVTDDEQSQTTNISSTPPETSNETSSSTTRQQVILTEGGNTQPSRNVILADSTVGEALKMPNAALIVPGSYIMPVSMVKGAQQIAVVSGGSKILATVPARSGQNMLLFQSFVNQHRKGAISAVKYSAIQPITGISSQSIAGVSAQPPVILPSNSVATAVALGQPITLKKIDDTERGVNTELLLTISQPRDTVLKQEEHSPEMAQPDSSTSLSSDSIEIKVEDVVDSSSNEKIYTFQKGNSVATSVISSCIKEELEEGVADNVISANINQSDIKEEETSTSGERIQSVLVNASASNGPMLSHTHTRYRKPSDSVDSGNTVVKEEFVPNGEKAGGGESKIYKGNTVYYAIKTKRNSASKKLESDLQKQAAIERELRLQKSLSEECEDLGVDEPSTSDLFPEADLLFDSNHSPSYDQTSQDIVKRTSQPTTSNAPVAEIKVESKTSMNLFSDDDENSSSLRPDLFDYVEYNTVENALNYQSPQIINGNNASNESVSSCEDNTLLPNCSTMSEVTLNSPISPEMYSDNTQPALNKYKYKYTNRKKGERLKPENWPTEVTSSEDMVVSNEPDKTLLPPKNPAAKSETTCDQITLKEDMGHDTFKVVRVSISKNDTSKEEEKCQLHCEDSKRGSRRSARKPCSCCNGSKSAGVSTSTAPTKKRPVSQQQTPAPHKKAFFNKKR